MASQTFSIGPTGNNVQTSNTVAVAVGEAIRVRFTEFTGPATASLKIVANSTTTLVTIDNKEAWVSGAVADGDTCSLEVKLNGSGSTVAGVIETF